MPVANILSDKNTTVDQLKTQREQYRNAKLMFTRQFDVLNQYFYQTQRNVSALGINQTYEGEFLNDGSITDNYGAYCAEMLCSAIMGYLWKGEKGTVQIVASKNLSVDKDVKDYFVRITNDFSSYLENKKSRFETSFTVAILEMIILGTTAMIIQRGDYSTPLRLQQRSVLNFYLGYDEDGNVDTIGFDKYLTARQIVEKYGVGKVPKSVLEAYKSNDVRTRFVVTEHICPRKNPVAELGKLSMPWMVVEFMPNDNAILGEGGYESFPVAVLFDTKLEYESYGRSRAMKALPTVIQHNIAEEILAEGGEATARPALGMYDNGSLAGKVLNLSGGALSVFNVSGSFPTQQPVFPLYQVGDLRVMYEWSKTLREKIQQFFMLDKLFSFGEGQRMQNPEVAIRDAIQANSISTMYVNGQNFMVEIFERGMDILFSMGLLGVKDPGDKTDLKVQELLKNGHTPFKIPEVVWEAMIKGIDWYQFEFISPAARIMRTESLRAATSFLNIIGEASALIPEFRYVIDPTGTAKTLREKLSAEQVMLRTPEQVAEIMESVAQQQAQAAALEAQRLQSQSNQSNAQAQATRIGMANKVANPEFVP